MRKATRKIYMSILAVLLVFITVVATTFAWVGILTYGQTDTFKLNLKTQDLDSEYYLSISATDEEDTYSETADEYEIKKQIIKNMGQSIDTLTSPQLIDMKFYSLYRISPVTTTRSTILNDEFHEINVEGHASTINPAWSHSFYKFDVYLSIEHRNGDAAIKTDTNAKMDMILANIADTLNGDVKTEKVSNSFVYPSNGIPDPKGRETLYGRTIDDDVKINAASAARVALAIYQPILRTEKYSGNETPKELLIYQGGTQLPTYDSEKGLYSFGGNLPEDYNLALYLHKKNRNVRPDLLTVPDEILNRNDMELDEDNDKIFDSEFGFGIFDGKKTKVKITVYFWFEGWDADCFEIIDAVNVRLNLEFAADSNIDHN